jgi:hypothetical protein
MIGVPSARWCCACWGGDEPIASTIHNLSQKTTEGPLKMHQKAVLALHLFYSLYEANSAVWLSNE